MALRGTNREFGRPYDSPIVLHAIRQHGPIARGDIAARLSRTVQTVCNTIGKLEVLDFMAGVRHAQKTRGHPATCLSINAAGGYAIGINSTPWELAAALINLASKVVMRHPHDAMRKNVEAA